MTSLKHRRSWAIPSQAANLKIGIEQPLSTYSWMRLVTSDGGPAASQFRRYDSSIGP
jgi:hypothetical protein